jgi:chromosomal replication initiation ATPase DnaA
MEGVHSNPWSYLGTIRMREIHDLIAERKRREDMDRISKDSNIKLLPFKKMVALIYPILENHYGITPEQIKGGKRDAEIVYVRHLFCYWLRKYYNGVTAKDIGIEMGQADHTTVLYSVKKYQFRLDANTELPIELGMPGITAPEDLQAITQKIINLCL